MLEKLRSIFKNPRQSKLVVGFIILLALSLPLIVWYAQKQQEIRQRASETQPSPPAIGTPVELYLSPFGEPISLSENSVVSNVFLNAGGYNISGVDFTVSFNDAILSPTQFTPSSTFNSVLTNTIDHTSQTLRFTAASTDTSKQITGDNVLIGTITFVPKTIGTAPVEFKDPQITAIGYTEALQTTLTNRSYIVAAPTATPVSTSVLPTEVPSAAPTGAPIPPTDTPIPTATPIPPTNTPIPPTATTVPVAGDINNDTSLDILDYNIWRNEFLRVVTTTQSDLNKDNKIDLLDFNVWRTAFQTFVTSPPTTSLSPQRFQLVRSVPNLIGLSVETATPITVQNFLSQTDSSCVQVKDLSGKPNITDTSTVLSSSAVMVAGKGYAVICTDVYGNLLGSGSEVVTIDLSGRPLTISDIKARLTSGWQYIAIPWRDEQNYTDPPPDYTAEQFLTDLSTVGGFNCTQIQQLPIYISSAGVSNPTWSPNPPYAKGNTSENFTLTSKAGYKIYCAQ